MKDPLLNVDITPNTKLLASLRSNNLSNNEAIADLLDNAIDADVHAKNVRITKTKDRITMADDGVGMNRDTLVDALKLGSEGRERPTITDLGLFGMGLKNSVLSLGKRTTIITKSVDDVYLTAIFNYLEIISSTRFEIPLYASSEEEVAEFNKLTHNSATGTVVVIGDLDRITAATDGSFTTSLIKHLGEVFRIFIKDGLNIFVNEILITAMDPIESDYSTNLVRLEDEIISLEAPDGRKFDLRIKIAMLPPLLKNVKANYKQNMTNQGFYVMRNDRQIKRANWLNFATQHNNLNRVRGEIYFSGDVDDIFGVPYEKNSVKMQEWLFDKLKNTLGGKLNHWKKMVESEVTSKQTTEEEKDDLNQIVENIDKKANRISVLKNKTEKPTSTPEKPGVAKPPVDRPSAEKPIVDGEEKGKRKLVNIAVASIGGPYICSFEKMLDGSLSIVLNDEHDFYNKFYRMQNLNTKDAFTKLLFALGRTIVNMSNETDAYAEMMDDFQRQLGETFRKLID